jgi:hypothetical protein
MRKYTSIFATPEHLPITKLKQVRRWGDYVMGFFCNGQVIGHGSLRRVRRTKILETNGTEIFKKFRNKGHGIQLYIHLIETARKLGAVSIQSDDSLNKFSERMWKEKLSKIYTVKVKNTDKECYSCHRGGRRRKFYWIDLT